MSSSTETSAEQLQASSGSGKQMTSAISESTAEITSFTPINNGAMFYHDRQTSAESFKSSSHSGDSSDESLSGMQEPNRADGSVRSEEKQLLCNVVEPTSQSKEEQPDENGNKQRKRSGTDSESDQHDTSYWEKRRKNNESAKRSREARRMKEEATRYTADVLMVEHQTLKQEKANLEEEIRQLRMALSAFD